MSSATAPKKITAAKKAKIGVDGYYNVDKNSIVVKTENAVRTGTAKGLIYNNEYGLVSSSQEAIDAFIEENELEPLAEGVLASAAPTSAGKAKPASAAGAAAAGAPSSAGDLQKIRAALEKKKPDKFVNIITMREVLGGKRDFEYNIGLGIAAKKEFAQKLTEVVLALGGSPVGGGNQAGAASSSSASSPPAPSSHRVAPQGIKFGKKVFGLGGAPVVEAGVESAVVAVQPVVVPVAVVAPAAAVVAAAVVAPAAAVVAPAAAVVAPAVAAPQQPAAVAPVPLKIVPRPATTLVKPVAGVMFAPKRQIAAFGAVAKP